MGTRWARAACALGIVTCGIGERGTAPSTPCGPVDGDGVRVGAALVGGDGACVVSPRGTLRLGLTGVGRSGAMRDVVRLAATRDGATAVVGRGGGVTEWWRSVPAGLEHGVTLAHRQAGGGPLVLELSAASLDAVGGDTVTFRDASGATVGHYAHLVVVDATGIRVPATMRGESGGVRIEIDDGGAAYPLIVDPLVVMEEAAIPRPVGSLGFGEPHAISGDGSALFSGEHRFVRSGSTWTEEPLGTRLVAGDLAADGSRIISAGTGGASVRARASAWAPEGFLVVSDLNGNLIESVALSDDGAWAAVADDRSMATAFSGFARVFSRSGTTWTASATLIDPMTVANDDYGDGVAVSGDGSRVMVGATARGGGYGEVVSFVRTGSTWALEGRYRSPSVGAFCGDRIALDRTGTRAIVNCGGNPRILVRSGSTWSLEHSASPHLSGPVTVEVDIDAAGARAVIGSRTQTGGLIPVYLYVRTGTTWASEPNITVPFASGGVSPPSSAPQISADGTRVAVVAVSNPPLRVFTLRQPDATACAIDDACVSGRCVDGVCCATACAGGTSDCQACSVAAGGTADGTCTALTAAAAASVTCRPNAGPCDVPERCVGGSVTCPTDTFAGTTLECRPVDPARGCDAPERCTGTAATCPMDRPLPAAAPCGTLAGACDLADTCDGVGFECVDRVQGTGFVCRPAAGLCDVADTCDGSAASCPADVVLPGGMVCGGAGTCRDAAACDGVTASCPAAGTLRPAGTECAPQLRDPITGDPLPCDVPDVCDGVSDVCSPRFAASGTSCGDAGTSGVCDAPDSCTGTSADCAPAFLSGVECRASSGTCDPAEVCLGDAATCPPDGVAPAGTVCRAASAACDPAESCDGTAASCPLDETTCADPDGGRGTDAGIAPGTDGGAAPGADGGAVAPSAAPGCGCSVASSVGAPLDLVLSFLLLVRGRARRGGVTHAAARRC